MIYAGTKGFLDKIAVGNVNRFEAGLLNHLRQNCADLLADITNNDRKVSDDLEAAIKSAIEAFASDFN